LVPHQFTIERARETTGESPTILRSNEKAFFYEGVGEEGTLDYDACGSMLSKKGLRYGLNDDSC